MSMFTPIIPLSRSIIIATDVPFDRLGSLVKATCDTPGVGGYKIGFMLGLEKGLKTVVSCIRDYTDLPIIYDHQKAGNDIPAMGEKFADICAQSGLDSVILFPFTGEASERTWIQACLARNLGTIVGGHMTAPQFFYQDGGSIAGDAPERIFKIAVEEGVRHFVVPGNQIEAAERYYQLLSKLTGEGENICLYAPGFVTQKGKIDAFSKIAGKYFHPIVGSAIYGSSSPREEVEKMVACLGTTLEGTSCRI